jgi:hypothetical protein
LYQNTNKARDCPEIEAFLAGIEEEVINSDLRRKIKDNTEGTHLAPMTLYTLHNVNANGEIMDHISIRTMEVGIGNPVDTEEGHLVLLLAQICLECNKFKTTVKWCGNGALSKL